tara:strand:+ start:265 stop:681 length:417 start_codon:yes stop_codon:yes gene_type:complete
MNKITLIIIVAFAITSCGYSSYEECKLKEIQKCESGACNSAATSYCQKKFPFKYKWVKAKNRNVLPYVDLEKRQFKIDTVVATDYRLCITYKGNEKCNDFFVSNRTQTFDLIKMYPNLKFAKSNSELSYTLKMKVAYR